VRVAVAEDDLVYRNGLVRLLEAAGVVVVHECATGADLAARLDDDTVPEAERPEVVLLDLRMAGQDDEGLVAAERITAARPGTGVLVLSASADARHAERLFANGSAGRGYLLKESLDSVGELREALERVRQGRTYVDPQVVDELVRQDPQHRLERLLTARELAVLTLLASGASNAGIAAATRTTGKSVEAVISALYAKLDIPDAPDYNRRVLVVLAWLARRPH